MLVAHELEARPVGDFRALEVDDRLGGLLQLSFGRFELLLRGPENLQGHDLGVLERAAEIPIGVENDLLPVNLILGRSGHLQISAPDVIETVGDVTAGNLHPYVRDPLQDVDLRIGNLIDHLLRIIANGIKRLRNLAVALADLHRLDLLADDFVEDAGLAKGPGDDDDPVLVEIRDLLQEPVDGRIHGLGRGDPKVPQG